jgi:hypothetical protein
MSGLVNQEHINDTAKLIMHRLIARKIGRDPSLVQKARDALVRSSRCRGEGYSFVQDWSDILALPTTKIRHLLTSRDENMIRLRLSSPFVLTEGIDLTDEALRRRIWRDAKQLASRAGDRGDRARIAA